MPKSSSQTYCQSLASQIWGSVGFGTNQTLLFHFLHFKSIVCCYNTYAKKEEKHIHGLIAISAAYHQQHRLTKILKHQLTKITSASGYTIGITEGSCSSHDDDHSSGPLCWGTVVLASIFQLLIEGFLSKSDYLSHDN